MMHQSRNSTSRVLQLVLCLGLIGGIGCVSTPTASLSPELANLQAEGERNWQTIGELQRNAAAGDDFASTKLGIDYILGNIVFRDVPQGMHLLEHSAANHYAPAEYTLGWIYLSGGTAAGGIQRPLETIPRQPQQGMELLKQSASHACNTSPLTPIINLANLISNLYRDGNLVATDSRQADLWRARSILHCRIPTRFYVASEILNPSHVTPQSKIEAMTLLLLMPSSDTATTLQSTLSAEDLRIAIRNASALRKAVADSEKQYPAPPNPEKP